MPSSSIRASRKSGRGAVVGMSGASRDGWSAIPRVLSRMKAAVTHLRGNGVRVAPPAERLILNEVTVGRTVVVLEVCGDPVCARRLGELGLFPGACVQVAGGHKGGDVVLRIGGSKLALCSAQARELVVAEA